MIAAEIAATEALRAVHAQVAIAPEQRLIVERGNVVVADIPGVAGMTQRRDDGADLQHRALTGQRVSPTVQLVERRAAAIGDLTLRVKTRCLAVVDPLQRHAGHVGSQHVLIQAITLLRRHDPQVVAGPQLEWRGTGQVNLLLLNIIYFIIRGQRNLPQR